MKMNSRNIVKSSNGGQMQEWTALGHIESCIFLMYIIVKMSARFNVSMEERSNDEKKTIIASSDDKKLAIKMKKKG